MSDLTQGPSDNAWGVKLCDPVMVSHEGRQVLFARQKDVAMEVLYFRVLDPSSTANAAVSSGWNGWYRSWMPQAQNRPPHNAAAAAEGRPNEVRIAGMDLLTVPPLTSTITAPADAPFRVISEGNTLLVFRPSTHGTIYMDRFVLVATVVEEGRETVERYSMEVAWEIRFKRSGLRDIPLNNSDGPGYCDAAGLPFPSPTVEFRNLGSMQSGLFDIAAVPTANSEVSQLYFLVAESSGFQLTRVQVSNEGVPDYAASQSAYTLYQPQLKSPSAALAPLTGQAPAIAFYGEQETAASPDGEASVDVPRAARLVCALPVSGGGLTAALAVFDLCLDLQGHVPDLPTSDQTIPLVDGQISQGTFIPDNAAPIFPTPANIAETLHVVDGLLVSGLVLGQVQPQRTPFLTTGEDGLLHLYFGGPNPSPAEAHFNNLVPNMPQALVAQCDVRVSRVALSVPWAVRGKPDETGKAVFRARLPGSIMAGTAVTISNTTYPGQDEPDLCDIVITYPGPTGFPTETWKGVPRELGTLMDILNGRATDDSADPGVLSGQRSYFDFTGNHPMVRVPLTPAPATGAIPVLNFVSTRQDLPLGSVTAGAGMVQLAFSAGTNTVTVTWPTLPAHLGAARDIFDGSADPATYGYPQTQSDTAVYALNTDATGVDAPVILYQTRANTPDYTIQVEPDTAHAGKLKVTITEPSNPATTFGNLPPHAADFVTALSQATGFSALGLGVSLGDAAGNVRTTAVAAGPIGLAAKSALFDVLVTPGADLGSLSFTQNTYHAITQKHDVTGHDLFAAVAVYVTSLRPESRLAAVVENGSGSPLPGPVRDAGWIRQEIPKACTFVGTDSISVPVTNSQGTRLPQSLNLRPQRTWTLESWIKPTHAVYQRLLTFDDGTTPLSPTDPVPQYAFATEGQEVISFGSFTPPNAGVGSFFQTHTTPNASVMPEGAFTLECWVQPDTNAALPPINTSTRYGGIVQAGDPTMNPFLSLLLARDRTVVLQTTDTASRVSLHPSTTVLPATDTNEDAVWSHLAVIGRQDGSNNTWTLDLLVDGQNVFNIQNVDLQSQPNAQLTIGRRYQIDSSFFGRMAQLRYWNVARPASDIRRTWRTSMNGQEPGLLGDWPLDGTKTGSQPGQKYARNNAVITGTAWDAVLNEVVQPVTTPKDSFFLSLIASVGGLPPVEADARLANGEWNHIAMTFAAGGALSLNPQDRYDVGVYDWAECPDSSALGTAPQFAIDAWVEIQSGLQGETGTIMAQWAPVDLPENQGYRVWVDANGELNFLTWAISEIDGTTVPVPAKSSGWALGDSMPHHVAVTVSCTNADPSVTPKIESKVTVTLYKDNGTPISNTVTLPNVETAELQASSMTVTVGRSYAPLKGAAPQAAEDYAPFRGKLGRLRYWSGRPTPALLFPETQRHVPQYGPPQGLTAQWDFREGRGRVCLDPIGGNDLLLNSSRPWSLFQQTSELSFVANGSFIGSTSPYTGSQPAVTPEQFTLGLPSGWTGSSAQSGFAGQVSRLSLYDGTRSADEIRAQRFTPRAGDEPRLLACWNFTDGNDDITGGGNNISPAPPAGRIVDADVPISNESPVVRNIYGGPVTRYSGSTPGRIAVGSYAVARYIGTDDQHAALLREYVLDPADVLEGGVQIGVMNLIYLGQVQTEPTLIGYIEGAPPVPSENLTRPYYLNPGSPGYMAYLDTSAVTLKQEAGTAMSFSSSSSQNLNVASNFAIGLIKVKSHVALITGFGVQTATNVMDHTVNIQATFTVDGSWGSGSSEELAAAWTSAQQNYMGFSGGWEAFQADQNNYFNPEVGRRFVPDNLGYALVESLTADQYALTLGHSNTATGVIVVPNPAIPPDRNIILFPMDNSYTLAGSLDGKIGLKNAPGYEDADIRRGSYFKPVQAYAKAKQIETRRARALAYFEQRDVISRAHGWNKDVTDATAVLPASFEGEPEGPVAVATPTQGLVNRYVWTADGGLYSETHATKATYTRSFTGTREEGGGGGFHVDGEHTFSKIGLAWSLDLMITKRVDLTTQKSLTEEQEMSMDVSVTGEAFLSKYDPDAPSEYGAKGNFVPGAAPGKVKAYRFMTIYDPPSMQNSADFKSIVDSAWLQQSNAPMARALRSANLSNPTWRVMHRVTYIERVPPRIASRPLYSPDISQREPVNLPGNAELIALILAQVPPNTALSAAVLTAAVAKAINPAPTGPGVYPPSSLEQQLAWWGTFLKSARPDAKNQIPDPKAAVVLRDLTAYVNDYVLAGYATGVLPSK